jgi:protease-4
MIAIMRPLWKEFVLLAAKSVATVFTVVLVVVATVGVLGATFSADLGISDGECNIAVLPIEGVILPFTGLAILDDFGLSITPSTVREFLDSATNDSLIEGILVEINSPGGTPVASEQIADMLHRADLPVVGTVGDVAASGGYMVAAATDFLLASAMSDVGSIGVNMSYVEESQKNEEEGLTYVQLITGEFKDTGTPNRPITDEERELLQAGLVIIHNEFIDLVAEYRELDRADVEALANGATMPGRRAADVGLIDSIGGRPQAVAAFAGLLDTEFEDVVFCEYEPPLLPF